MCINTSVIIYQACQTPEVPPVVRSLQRIEFKSTLDSGGTTGRVKSFFSFFFFSCALFVLLISGSGKLMVPIFPSFYFILLANCQWKKWKTMLTKQCWKHLKVLCIRKQNSQFKRWHCPLPILWIERSSVAVMCSEVLEVTFFGRETKPSTSSLN